MGKAVPSAIRGAITGVRRKARRPAATLPLSHQSQTFSRNYFATLTAHRIWIMEMLTPKLIHAKFYPTVRSACLRPARLRAQGRRVLCRPSLFGGNLEPLLDGTELPHVHVSTVTLCDHAWLEPQSHQPVRSDTTPLPISPPPPTNTLYVPQNLQFPRSLKEFHPKSFKHEPRPSASLKTHENLFKLITIIIVQVSDSIFIFNRCWAWRLWEVKRFHALLTPAAQGGAITWKACRMCNYDKRKLNKSQLVL